MSKYVAYTNPKPNWEFWRNGLIATGVVAGLFLLLIAL